MADEKDFAKELNALIKQYVDGGCDPQDIADELLREANSVFGHYNLEICQARCWELSTFGVQRLPHR